MHRVIWSDRPLAKLLIEAILTGLALHPGQHKTGSQFNTLDCLVSKKKGVIDKTNRMFC